MNKRKKKNTNKKVVESIISLCIVALLGLIGIYQGWQDTSEVVGGNIQENVSKKQVVNLPEGDKLEIYFWDVGQADSILLRNEEQTMLIDAGNNADGKWLVGQLQNIGIAKIDYLIGTHPHEDHIGGLDDVIKNFEIGTIYMPKVQTNTKTFEDVLDAISEKGLKITTPEVGSKFYVGNAECEIMACGSGTKEEQSNLNLSSIVIRTTYGEQSYLFMGDAEEENELARNWSQTTVLKVGHHGSDTSSSIAFLNQVKPEISIISVGEDNSYGHPKQAILNRLQEIGSKIYRTDKSGTILLISDGKKIEIEERG